MIFTFQPAWIDFVKDIDIKASNWAWCDEGWNDISQYIIRTYWGVTHPWEADAMKGLSVFQIRPDCILISKLMAHPLFQNDEVESVLLLDIEAVARRHGIRELRMTVWENDEYLIPLLGGLDFKAIGLRGKFPDGSDGFEFLKGVI